MLRPRPLPSLGVVVLSAVLFAACSSGEAKESHSPKPPTTSPPSPPAASPLPKCNLPREIPFPKWVPEDLPLPDGTYASRRLPETVGYSRGLFVLPMGTSDFARYVLKVWPEAGWQLGRGDAEPGEVEDQFIKSPAFGAFKAQDMVCREPHSLLLLIYVPDRSQLPSVSTQPSSPLPGTSGSPSPSPS